MNIAVNENNILHTQNISLPQIQSEKKKNRSLKKIHTISSSNLLKPKAIFSDISPSKKKKFFDLPLSPKIENISRRGLTQSPIRPQTFSPARSSLRNNRNQSFSRSRNPSPKIDIKKCNSTPFINANSALSPSRITCLSPSFIRQQARIIRHANIVPPELDPNIALTEEYLANWMDRFSFELKNQPFASLLNFCVTSYLDIRRQTENLTLPHPIRTKVCAGLLKIVAERIPKYSALLRCLTDEMLCSTFSDYYQNMDRGEDFFEALLQKRTFFEQGNYASKKQIIKEKSVKMKVGKHADNSKGNTDEKSRSAMTSAQIGRESMYKTMMRLFLRVGVAELKHSFVAWKNFRKRMQKVRGKATHKGRLSIMRRNFYAFHSHTDHEARRRLSEKLLDARLDIERHRKKFDIEKTKMETDKNALMKEIENLHDELANNSGLCADNDVKEMIFKTKANLQKFVSSTLISLIEIKESELKAICSEKCSDAYFLCPSDLNGFGHKCENLLDEVEKRSRFYIFLRQNKEETVLFWINFRLKQISDAQFNKIDNFSIDLIDGRVLLALAHIVDPQKCPYDSFLMNQALPTKRIEAVLEYLNVLGVNKGWFLQETSILRGESDLLFCMCVHLMLKTPNLPCSYDLRDSVLKNLQLQKERCKKLSRSRKLRDIQRLKEFSKETFTVCAQAEKIVTFAKNSTVQWESICVAIQGYASTFLAHRYRGNPIPCNDSIQRKRREFITTIDKTRLSTLIHDEEDLKKLQNYCNEYEHRLSQIFQYYAGQANGDDDSLDKSEWMRFVKDTNLMGKTFGRMKKKSMAAFKSADSWCTPDTINKNKESTESHESDEQFSDDCDSEEADECLNRQEFLEALIKLASLKYKKPLSISEKFKRLMEKYLMHYEIEKNKFREEIRCHNVVNVLKKFRKQLKKIFKYYLKKQCKREGKRCSELDCRSLKGIMHSARLTAHGFTDQHVQTIYSTINTDGGGLIFEEFIEAFCAVCICKNPNPYIPLCQKLTQFLHNDIVVPLLKEEAMYKENMRV